MRPSRPTMCHKQTFNLNHGAARAYWTELCFIKLPTIARNISGLSLAAFWNSASSEDSDAPGCFSIKSSISFSAASMVLDLSWFMVSTSYRRRASTLCRELRLSVFVQSMSAAQR